MKITVETFVSATMDKVWNAWNNPADIQQWNAADPSWHTTLSTVDLREGGKFSSRMEAKDGSQGFDFGGTYTRVVPQQLIEYQMGDGRNVSVEFAVEGNGVAIKETFDAESVNDPDKQRAGWQAILNNFAQHVHAKQ
ncbi:MAG TPA: SRPBCC family protein [Longimicrobiales bacterium]|nr:SRPBCC family protein [Longimicrobiales bacterium]